MKPAFESIPAARHRPRWSLRGVADAALCVGLLPAVGLCLLTLAAFAGEHHWLLELTTHFRPHYAGGLLVCAIIYASARRIRPAALFALFTLLNIFVLAPRFTPRGAPPVNSPSIKLLLSNVLSDNHDHDSLLALIAHEQPDVITLLEINDEWTPALVPLTSSYPHSLVVTRDDNFGIALFSRFPLSDLKTVYLGPAEIPSIRATLMLGSRPVALLATHPLPPGNAGSMVLRDLHLTALAKWSASLPSPVIVLGDLNCTPWSPAFRTLLTDGSLYDTGRGFNPTWPARPWWLRIPLDHCLVSADLAVVDHRIGPDIGSDHFPLLVTVALPASSADAPLHPR